MTYYTSSQHSVKPQPYVPPNIWWKVQIMKLPITQVPPTSLHTISSFLSPAILLSTMGSYTSASHFHTMEVKNLTIMQNVQ